MALQLTYTPKPDDMLEYLLWQQSQSPSARRQEVLLRFILPTGLVALFLVIAAVNILNFGLSLEDYQGPAALLALLVAWVLCYPYEVKRRLRREINRWETEDRGKGLFVERVVTIDENGIRSCSTFAQNSFPWTAVERVEEARDHAFITMSNLQALVIPRMAFATDGDYQKFIEAIRQYHASNHP